MFTPSQTNHTCRSGVEPVDDHTPPQQVHVRIELFVDREWGCFGNTCRTAVTYNIALHDGNDSVKYTVQR